MKITVTHDDGTEQEITEGVQVAFDVAYNSMDWGSGFLDMEEMDALAKLAESCRFPSFEDALKAVQTQKEAEEKRQIEAMNRAQKARIEAEARSKAIAEIARSMRQKEPELVRAGWTDDQLYTLYVMRKDGRA